MPRFFFFQHVFFFCQYVCRALFVEILCNKTSQQVTIKGPNDHQKQNRSSRQSHCVATSNRHVHFLSLSVTCYKCFIAIKVGWAATGKVKSFIDTVLELL